MNLPEFGVKRPVTNLMIFFSIIIIAGYSLTRLGVDMMPEIEPPVISVISTYPGASSEDVEIKVTEPLENQLATTPGVEKISSRSIEGVSIISLKFIWGTNLDEASNDIRDRIELSKRVLPDIPDEMENPFIFKFNTANIPILFFGVTANQTYPELYELIDKRVGDALRQLPGVGTVQLMGGLERQINIWIDRERLEGYGFSILDIKNALREENVTQPLGSIKTGFTDYLLRLPGEFTSPEEINLVILGKRDNKFVYLRDVAKIEDGFKEVAMKVRINKTPSIMMMVQKQAGTNTVQVAAMVKEKIKKIEPTLPSDVKMYTIFDTSKDIITALESLKGTLWIGVILVIFVVWFFLRQLFASIIIALTIPFSLLIAFIYLFLSGKTMNVISISALAIAAGLVVDNAIVVVDNAMRHIERGERPQEAAIFGTSEILLAVGASTLTTIVVFMPMLFISGVVGIIFGQLAAIIIVTLLASLFTASTFTPMLCSRWLKLEPKKDAVTPRQKWFSKFYETSERWFDWLEDIYEKALNWCMHHKKTVIAGFLGAFILSLFLSRFIGNEFIPEEDSGDIRITVELPLGTRLEETDKVAQKIEDILRKSAPEAQYVYVRSGEPSGGMGRAMGGSAGKHVIVSGAKLVPKTERERSVKEVGQVIREKIEAIPGVIKTDVSTGNPIGRLITGMGGKAIQVEIIGHSFDETNALAQKIKTAMEKVPGVVDTSISRDINRPELVIEVDREKAATLGLTMNTIASSVKTFVEGSTATKYREKGETYDIYVRLEESFRSKVKDVANLSIVSTLTGEQIKLANFAKVYEKAGPVEIERQNRERVVRVECNVYNRSAGKVKEDIEKELRNIVVPADMMINFGGEAEEQGKAFKDLTLLLLLGIILVYMVMAAQFESLVDPFIVMFAVPFTFTGVFLGFLLTGTTLSLTSFLGIIMLMGIVVNNAIVLISYINILRARGYSMLDAVTKGGKDRLRPVLMTTITTLAALLPMTLSRGEGSESWQPLGITIMSGLSLSTLITMLFVPTLYAIVENRMKKNGGKTR
ncbi:MAG: efflux RND transporter permease subunit [Candidatus Omnitrophica bacterium]|nr:efflux RND transporter permease subunit [Candidatus Omnitrophota bacterium]MCG2705742.1 efflux RND transporter permease subunit [Candidatus Omnitrophota bacterium]